MLTKLLKDALRIHHVSIDICYIPLAVFSPPSEHWILGCQPQAGAVDSQYQDSNYISHVSIPRVSQTYVLQDVCHHHSSHSLGL